MKLVSKYATLKIKSQNIDYSEISTPLVEKKQISIEDNVNIMHSVNIPDGFPSIILHMNEFTKQHVGAKSNNTKRVFGNLPSWVMYPESIAIPFNVCEYFLEAEENIHIRDKLKVYIYYLFIVSHEYS